MSLQVSGFRFALNVILVGSVICGVILGGSSGAVMSFGSGWGILIGAVVGGFMGWLTGTYAHGIGYTLLSINDHLERLAGGRSDPAPSAVAAARPVPPRASPPAPAEATPGPEADPSLSWRERLERLPVDKSIDINGRNVWKLKNGEVVYFFGDKIYKSIDDVLAGYGVS